MEAVLLGVRLNSPLDLAVELDELRLLLLADHGASLEVEIFEGPGAVAEGLLRDLFLLQVLGVGRVLEPLVVLDHGGLDLLGLLLERLELLVELLLEDLGLVVTGEEQADVDDADLGGRDLLSGGGPGAADGERQGDCGQGRRADKRFHWILLCFAIPTGPGPASCVDLPFDQSHESALAGPPKRRGL